MKKTLSLLLTLVLLLGIATNMTACEKKTELTAANVEDYINFKVWEWYESIYGGAGPLQKDIVLSFRASAEGVSSNFNYNEVYVKLRIYGSCALAEFDTDTFMGREEFEAYIHLYLNISGSTNEFAEVQYVVNTYYGRTLGEAQRITSCYYDYEIVEVSGYLTPA